MRYPPAYCLGDIRGAHDQSGPGSLDPCDYRRPRPPQPDLNAFEAARRRLDLLGCAQQGPP